MIRFTKVSKDYPRLGAALSNVSFNVAKGEYVFLTGPSGAGKSTILKLIYMEERPTDGEVRVGGMSSVTIKRSDIPKLRRRLINQGRQDGDITRDSRLIHIEDVRPHLLDKIMSRIPTHNHERLAQRQFLRATGPLIPRPFKQFADTRFQLIQLPLAQT